MTLTDPSAALAHARAARRRLAELKQHQTEERTRLRAMAVQQVLDAGLSLREAADALGLSPSHVQRASRVNTASAPPADPHLAAMDQATESFVLGDRDTP